MHKRSLKRVLVGAVVAQALAFVGAAAFADSVVIRGNNAVPPKAYEEGGEAKGFAVDAAKAVLEDAGYTVSVELTAFADAMKNVVSQGGVVTGIFKTTEREKAYLFTNNEVIADEVFIVTKVGKEFPFSTAKDLAGKKIGYTKGASFGDEFAQAKKDGLFTSVEDTDPAERVKTLMAGGVDAIIINPGLGALALAAEKAGVDLAELSALPEPLAMLPNYIAVAKETPGAAELIAKMDASIAKLRADGTLDTINAKYAQ
jgi:polar amino acid transport system substrate-binding protein